MKKDRWIWGILNFLFPLCLLSFALIGVNQGADLTDTTYSMGNYMYFDSMDGSWKYATFLANLLGSRLILITGGSFLWMNVISKLLVGLIAVICYFCMKQYVSPYLVFAGEIIALGLCWCPTVIFYNYLSYLFFAVAALLLIKACREENSSFLFLAGCFLGINVMVRIPNVLQVLMILVVWYHVVKSDKGPKLKLFFQKTGVCIAGFAAGFLITVVIMILSGGGGGFSAMVEWLMSMLISGSDSGGYSAGAMLGNIMEDYALNLKWTFIIVAGMALGCFLFRKWNEKYLWVAKAGYICWLAVMVVYFYRNWVFRLDYGNYSAIFNLSVIFIMLGSVLAVWQLTVNRKEERESELAILLLVIFAISPLGSNNHLYSSINNFFVAAPIVIHLMKKMADKYREKREGFPIRWMMRTFVLLLGAQSFFFHLEYVFRGPAVSEYRNYCLQEANVMNGMRTNEAHGKAMEELCSFMKESKSDRIVLYGEIPGVSYLLGQECAVSTSWPDLASFSLEDWEDDLRSVGDWNEVSIIVSPDIIMWFGAEEITEEELPSFMAEDSGMEKVQALYEVIQGEGFTVVFENEEFVVYQTE
ncbi:MAG: hypothetical protein E7285_06590 [Lachnospiraceae bacterium]|nr:hypothetical protein [Lachnospiraceae bacterium]